MERRWFVVVPTTILAWALAGSTASAAGIFRGPWDFSLGPYTGGHGYSYAEAYGYGLPFSPAQFPDVWHYPYGFGYYVGGWSGTPNYYTMTPRQLAASNCAPPPPGSIRIQPPPTAIPGPPLLPVNPGDTAVIEVNLPPDAELWFDRDRTAQTGPARLFTSPALPPGKNFHYAVRVRWMENGKVREQMETVSVRAGERIRLDFPRPQRAE